MGKNFKIISVVPAICIMVVIFYFSSQTAIESSGMSGGITENLFNMVVSVSNIQMELSDKIGWLNIMETLIRKLAHMTEYAILAVTVSFPFYVYGKRKSPLILWSELVCVIYAATDEFHQLFVLGRSGQIIDVLIDGSGSLIGCCLFVFFIKKRYC